MHHASILQILGFIVSVITMGILLWYTIETFKLRKESQKQTSALWRPILDFQGNSPWDLNNFPLVLLNLGKGIAKNITGYIIFNRKKYKIYFSSVGDNAMLESYDGMGYLEYFKTGIHAKIKLNEFENLSEENIVFFKYQDINNKWYKTEIYTNGMVNFSESAD